MKNKGFTLVELLGTILILALVMIIGVPKIIEIVYKSKMEIMVKNEQKITNATENYLVKNRHKFPKGIGDTVEVTLSELKTDGFIDIIKSPYGKNEGNGYVLVTKTDKHGYEYLPHLNYVQNIENLTQDGLVLHYKFDDFQEPTINLITNGDFTQDKTGWDNNQNVSSTVIDYLDKKFIEVTSNQASSTPGIISTGITIVSNAEYTLSIIGQCLSRNAYVYIGGNNTGNLVWTGPRLVEEVSDLSITFNTKTNTSIRIGILFGSVQEGNKFVATNFQLEKKTYKTPFVNGTREGIVRDYSGNGNQATLSVTTTPKWVEDSKIGEGTYLFDGNRTQYINAGNNDLLNLATGGTISAWINMTSWGGTSWSNTIIGKGGSSWPNHHYILFKHNNTQKIHLSVSDGKNYLGSNGPQTANLELNKWYYIVATWDDTKKCIYCNGILSDCKPSNIMPINSPAPVSIGRTGTNGYYFNGLIDDVRIYNRALSDEEIKQRYQIDSYRK